jgi:hypothetical protein
VAEIGTRLNDRLVDVSGLIRAALEDEIAELRGDARLVELLGASVEGNVDTVLHALRHDIAVERAEAPTAALEYARRLAQHGVPVNALVRAYRLGQRRMNEVVFGEVRDADIPTPMRVAVLETITATLFEYIDWISQQVVAVYEDERERWLENQNSVRAVRVREVLAGRKPGDVDADTESIRYPLRWHHVAVVMWYPDLNIQGDELARLQRFARELGQAAIRARPLCSSPPTGPAGGRGCRTGPNRRTPSPRCAGSPTNEQTLRALPSGPLGMAPTVSANRTGQRRPRARWRSPVRSRYRRSSRPAIPVCRPRR